MRADKVKGLVPEKKVENVLLEHGDGTQHMTIDLFGEGYNEALSTIGSKELELDLATIEEIYRAWRVGAYGDMSLSQAISSRIEEVLKVKE